MVFCLVRITIPGTNVTCSKLILGTANMSKLSRGRRIRLLEAAVSHGITHFDTAPIYGFGWAERDLAQVLSRHKNVGVTTKVGLYSPGGENQSEWSVFLRKSIGRAFPALSRAQANFIIDRARLSLDQSLARLGRAHIELYLLHEPSPDVLITDEWCRWLEDEVAKGRISTWGCAVRNDILTQMIRMGINLPPVIQTIDSLDEREADCLSEIGRPLQITYSYVSSALSRTKQPVDVPSVLRKAIKRNHAGAIIVGTTNERRMTQFASAMSVLR